jgi:hypothetical protein
MEKTVAQAVSRARLRDIKPLFENKMYTVVPVFFGNRFGGKEGCLLTYKPSSQELGDKIDFFKAA